MSLIIDENSEKYWSSTETNVYDVDAQCIGAPSANQVLRYFTFPRSVNFNSLYVSAGIAPTNPYTFNILQNGVVVANPTITGTTPVSSAINLTFSHFDVLTVTAPASADVTLANIGITLSGMFIM